jgi:magnesium chelatase subunit I
MTQFPFTAIVGMEDAKRSLIYHAIDPKIGGSLLLGHRGCAKTTLVRAFAGVLQAASTRRVPFVELPLGATEDRLLGSVSAEALVEKNRWETRIGLIEEANGGVLYVDEINLLPDHLADHVLDSAASGKHHIERDGITRQTESRYILIGTMNPDEGDLRPQLSDRFAHGIVVQDEFTPEQRMEVVRRRIQFDDDPDGFVEMYAASLNELTKRLNNARTLVKRVGVSDQQRLEIANQARRLQLEGLRAELAVLRTARCAAAWENRLAIEKRDLDEAWRMCLGHRQSRNHSPTSAPSPPASVRKFSPAATQRTSVAPINSLPDPRELTEPKMSPHQLLRDWVNGGVDRPQSDELKIRSGAVSAAKRGAINWVATLLASVKGERCTGRKVRLCYYTVHRRPKLWCFLDASRSTGMSQFLSAARDSLMDLAVRFRSLRWDLLLLHDSQIKWMVKNGNSRSFKKALTQVNDARGKSHIYESINYLHRAILRQGNTARDRVIIVSDGLASPDPGEDHRQTAPRLHQHLRRITRMGVPTVWLYPSQKRGLSRWLHKVFKGLPVTGIELKTARDSCRSPDNNYTD